jgi:TRAP transporter TAXI family solute receptor
MCKTLFRFIIVGGLLLLPFAAHWFYRAMTALPSHVTIATGPEGGAYRELSMRLASEMEARHGLTVELVHTNGSAENLQLLHKGQVDFALYMAAPQNTPSHKKDAQDSEIAFVANVYSEVAHLVVRGDTKITSASELSSHSIALGKRYSANHALSLLILKHIGIDEDEIDAKYLDYPEMTDGLLNGTLDAAIITAGVRAPIFQRLASSGRCRILSMPFAKALASKHLLLGQFEIPAGRYWTAALPVPATDIETVAARAQLLTRTNVPSKVVKAVTATILNAGFQQQNGLRELSENGRRFAQERPQFEVHSGVKDFYDPEFRPLLNPDFVEATEGMRSFIVSLLIAVFLGYRWLKEHRNRKNEHKLDRYFRSALDIETRQITLDSDSECNDVEALQKMLDEVTVLRQEALTDFSAHELSQDRAADCFLEMCHALSNKIDAKLLRQRLDVRFREMATNKKGRLLEPPQS